jgi:hypothetical protein
VCRAAEQIIRIADMGQGEPMPNLKLTLACWDYDRTRALFDGRVKAAGVDLDLWSTRNVGEIMERMLRDRQFDVSELGITYYLRSLELMDAPFIAIPVFPNRFFRHSAIFVNAEKSIHSPRDLSGRRVGELLRYGHDAGIWAKGVLNDEFGVTASSMIHYWGPPGLGAVGAACRCNHHPSRLRSRVGPHARKRRN